MVSFESLLIQDREEELVACAIAFVAGFSADAARVCPELNDVLRDCHMILRRYFSGLPVVKCGEEKA